MRPYPLHLIILALLMIPGIVSFLIEFFSDQTGGWFFSRYTLTKLYWLVYMAYLVFSSFIVVCVHLIFRIRKRRFTKLAVSLSHIIPVGVVWMSLSFGIHDFIQDSWNRWTNPRGSNLSNSAPKKPKQKPPIPKTPLSKPLLHQPPETKIHPPEQMTTRGPNEINDK